MASALILSSHLTSHSGFRLPEAVISFAQQGKETGKAFWTPHRHGGVSTEAGASPPKVVPSQTGRLLTYQLGYQQICCPETQGHLHWGPLPLLGSLTCGECHRSKSWSTGIASLLKPHNNPAWLMFHSVCQSRVEVWVLWGEGT